MTAGCALSAPTVANAATGVARSPLTRYNSTPDCPVSADSPVCGPWNVPADPNSPFGARDYGQCTYWASVKYPSLVSDESPADPLGENWDGSTWAEHAQQEGIPVVSTPAPGDLAVFGASASDPYGHVAYVEAVNRDGSIVVSQMDGQDGASDSSRFAPMQGSTEYLTAAELQFFQQTVNLEYIDTGDSDTGTPRSYIELPPAFDVTYRLQGKTLIVSASVLGSGRVWASAAQGGRTISLSGTRYGDNEYLDARLGGGRWTVRVLYAAGGVPTERKILDVDVRE